MDSELTQLEKDILELRVKKCYTENETLEELNITKYQYILFCIFLLRQIFD